MYLNFNVKRFERYSFSHGTSQMLLENDSVSTRSRGIFRYILYLNFDVKRSEKYPVPVKRHYSCLK